MPSYELALILRKLGRPETAKVLKRTAQNIYKNEGVLFGIENLGTRPLPFSITSFNRKYREGSYFLMRFDSPPTSIARLYDEYTRDIDILRAGFVREKPIEEVECLLEDELKPPAYREDVKVMLEEGKKRERQYDMKIGLKYNPLQR